MSDAKPRTVRVRIAVAVDSDYCWNVSGWRTRDGQQSDNDIHGFALEGMEPHGAERVVFVEADVPVPEPVTVQGEVTTKSEETR